MRTLTSVLIAIGISASAHAGPPSAEDFGRLPEITQIELSPSGHHYVALRFANGAPRVVVYDRASGKALHRMAPSVKKKRASVIEEVFWLNDERIGIGLRYVGEGRLGTFTDETRLASVDLELTDYRFIPRSLRNVFFKSQLQNRILHLLPDDPDHILMGCDSEGQGRLDVCRVHVVTGKIASVDRGEPQTRHFLVDPSGRARVRVDLDDRKSTIFYREAESSLWQQLEQQDRNAGHEIRPVAAGDVSWELVTLRLNEQGMDELYSFDPAQRKHAERILKLEGRDIQGVTQDFYTGRIVGASYADHTPKTFYFDQELSGIQHAIDTALAETHNELTSADRERKFFIVRASSPTRPGEFFLFNRDEGTLRSLGRIHGDRLKPEQLSPVTPLTYEARDGLSIPAYLTRPAGDAPLPLVVLPHGGPNQRDYLGFDFMAQFLASRGYAVLQPNFRGSSGYGAVFEQLGYEQWGLAMQDDVTDGVLALIEQGIAHPQRICIVGWSYGGYAALMGTIKTPDLYRCAVAGAAVTDIPALLRDRARYKFATRDLPSIGRYREDKGTLRDNSPVNNADAIQAAILLLHGEVDLTVPFKQGKRMAAQLKKKRVPHRFVALEDAGHFLSDEATRIRVLQEMERFLAEHLRPKPRARTASSAPRGTASRD